MEKKRISKKNNYFLKKLETMSVEELKNLQLQKTKGTLERAYYKSEFYRDLFDKAKVKPEDLKKTKGFGPKAIAEILEKITI